MLEKLICWITDTITGIDHTSMNLNEFFTWFTTMLRVHDVVYTTVDVILVTSIVLAVIGVAYSIVSSVKRTNSKEEVA